MPRPKCEKCSWHPEMEVSARKKVLDTGLKPGQSTQMGMHLRRTGHPGMALAAGIVAGAAAIGNHFFETVVYRCRFCGETKDQTERK